jgi:hypothetical protein
MISYKNLVKGNFSSSRKAGEASIFFRWDPHGLQFIFCSQNAASQSTTHLLCAAAWYGAGQNIPWALGWVTYFEIPAVLFPGCATLGKLASISVPQFSHL